MGCVGEAESADGANPAEDSVAGLEQARPQADPIERERLLAKVTAGLTSQPAAPVKIERHVILHALGEGGLGVVYAAYDPRLDRKVAIKLLRAPALSDDAREATLAEARALAKLAHPNVVAVHEVGEHAGGLFIVMELVEGAPLDRWQTAAPREQAELVEVYVQAGRGLAGAHERGLVHRDFKPANVLVGEDRRVRVVDFGLAQAAGIDQQADGSSMTGTPAYMAPEQQRGEEVDARSDQYAFCVALYEALFGQRPFTQKTVVALLDAKENGPPVPPSGARVDPRIRRAVLRGLAPSPRDRFPDMNALLAELDVAPFHLGRWVAGGVVAGTLFGLGQLLATDEAQGVCSDPEARLAGVWDDDARGQIAAAFRGSGAKFSNQARDTVYEGLDEYTVGWMQAYASACELAETSQIGHASLACLEDRRRELGAIVSVFAAADREVVSHAVTALGNLRSVQPCSDPDYLDSRVEPPDAAARDAVDTQRQRLLEAGALHAAGKWSEALVLAENVQVVADEIGYAPLQARARLHQGLAQDSLGQHEEAEQTLSAGWHAALASHDDELAARIATAQTSVIGFGQARPEEGLFWARNARALLDRSQVEGAARARLARAEGAVLIQAGRYVEGEEREREALELRLQLHGERDVAVAAAHNGLGNALARQGRYEEALEHYRQTLDIRRELVSPQHPAVATVLDNMGVALFEQGEIADAVEHYRDALAIREQALGESHRDVGNSLNNLGDALRALGRYEEALEHHQRSRRIFVEALGPDHPHVGVVVANIGNVLWYMEDLDGAREHYEQALASFERAFGPDHVNVAVAHDNIARVLSAQGKLDSAIEHHRIALRILEASLGPNHRSTIGARLAMAGVMLDKGEADAAHDELVAAREAGEQGEIDRLMTADLDFVLARAKFARGDRDGARELALGAREVFAAVDDPAHDNVGNVDIWLEKVGLDGP